jgi:hypothetical protein
MESQEIRTEETVKEQKPWLFKKGESGNPAGRPKGSLSVIGRLKQMWEEDPEDFESFVKGYKADPLNRKHITEMIDGKPQQDITSGGETLQPLLVRFIDKEEPNADNGDSERV